MDISINNAAGVTKNFYEFPSDIAAALIHAGIARPVVKVASVVVKPGSQWYVGHSPYGDRLCIAFTLLGGEKRYYDGPAIPDRAEKAFGILVPENIWQQYVKRLGGAEGMEQSLPGGSAAS